MKKNLKFIAMAATVLLCACAKTEEATTTVTIAENPKVKIATVTTEAVAQLKEQGYTLLAIEQVEGAVMLDKLTVDSTKKYALIFGNEVMGVDQAVVNICDGAIEIPQVGTKHSINVSVCGGVVLWKFFENRL